MDCSKVKYPDKKSAMTQANVRTASTRHAGKGRRRRNHKPVFLRAYHCPYCDYWHLTKQEDRYARR